MSVHLKRVAWWVVLILPLELIWEIAQFPLYTLWRTGTPLELTYAALHCTIGDGLIAATCYAITAVLLRDSDWPLQSPWTGGTLSLTAGLLYTAASEWHHIQAGDWAYAPAMPLLFGIGIAPLLQWLLLPALNVLAYRRFRPAAWLGLVTRG
jgi:hypothetical protein